MVINVNTYLELVGICNPMPELLVRKRHTVKKEKK